ncbi:tRNA (guanine(10)-N2)-methyltransferase homolog [Linum grandiflorum]
METDDYGGNNGLPPVVAKRIFFGREIGGSDRKLIPTYQLKSRTYLGPTAMDAEMAFLMANQALVKPGKLVYDPFVGTGSILIGAAHFGAMTMVFVRDGRGPDRNVWSNFKQIFDAIICDPPYGVRAGGIIGPYTVPDEKRTDHIPSTAPYSLAKMLVMGGRLVYFYPVLREEESVEVTFPEHPCFELISSSEQILSSRYSRVLLTMVKRSPYTEEVASKAKAMHADFRENHVKWMEDGNLHSSVFCPADQLTMAGDNTKSFKELKPKYRGKYV